MASKMIEFVRPDGGRAPGYLEIPRGGDAGPAVVVVQEWWGLNPQIKGVARRLSDAGYRALVPDLFRGKITTDRDEASHLMSGLDWTDAAEQDLTGAARHLSGYSPGKVAVLGFCMGGALALVAAAKVRELAAGVCFYGIPPTGAVDFSAIRAPLQLHFATDDDWCNPAAVEQLERSLDQAKVRFELHRYHAQHAFMNETRPEVHDPKAAEVAWERALQFLGQNLGA